ncbi:unnamed protein product [Thelazia callipaeda]|uniref:CCR4-NOT transcription complex subunit 11 n=1 Tax=Thelazia callipaeda TaxID=103827 RepID=A0A158RBS9_THECL|nr:unnamed protein product [Thelazia callipaeda]
MSPRISAKITAKDFDVILKQAFSGRHSCFSVGSAILLLFKQYCGAEHLRHRVILIYLLYRSPELDGGLRKNNIAENPFLCFFLTVMKYDSNSKDKHKDVELLGTSRIGPPEKYITGCLLTEALDKITPHSPVDIIMMKIPKEDFDIREHIMAIQDRQMNYPLITSVTIPAGFKVPSQKVKTLAEIQKLSSALILKLFKNCNLMDVLPPRFHRITPLLMPVSDDEVQFLFPCLLEPLWMETKVNKQRWPSSPTLSSSSTFSFVSATTNVSSTSDHDSLYMSCETSSCSLEKDEENSSVKLADDISNEEILTSKSSRSSVASDKKQSLSTAEAAELLKKSLVSIITRTDSQKLTEAIAKDPSLTKIVDIPLTKFDRYIDENPTIAAAVIVNRITENCYELPRFFKLLAKMKISVQAMEVVNKLCTQIEFPQEYLNSYITTCMRRCNEPGQTLFAQCRQVRVVCVFLSSLIRSRIWDVRPLSVELQAFVLKFNHVREAASLYQAILMALQPTLNSVVTSSKTSSSASLHATTSNLLTAPSTSINELSILRSSVSTVNIGNYTTNALKTTVPTTTNKYIFTSPCSLTTTVAPAATISVVLNADFAAISGNDQRKQ